MRISRNVVTRIYVKQTHKAFVGVTLEAKRSKAKEQKLKGTRKHTIIAY